MLHLILSGICLHRWSKLPKMNFKRDDYPGICWLKSGVVIVAGGHTGSKIINSVEALVRTYRSAPATSPQPTARWRPLAPMNQPRSWFSMCEFGGSVLAVGGDGISGVESFTPPVDFSDADQLGQWTDIQPMTRAMRVHGLVVFPDGIIAAGMVVV